MGSIHCSFLPPFGQAFGGFGPARIAGSEGFALGTGWMEMIVGSMLAGVVGVCWQGMGF
jgi:hypothetical protein